MQLLEGNIEIWENLDLQDLDGEIWKVIEDFPDYMISNLGRVKSFKKWCGINKRILKLRKNDNLYFIVGLSINKKSNTKKVHILVYETFYNDKLKLNECVHHKDENKENNYYENLIKMTKHDHKSLHFSGKNNPNSNKNLSGENNINHILIKKQIIQIKMLIKLGFKNIEISKIYNVSPQTISNIKNNKSWSHIGI
ncbi:MAG: NUMOD4 domain-containing protein [Patescibacteria group bacterium]